MSNLFCHLVLKMEPFITRIIYIWIFLTHGRQLLLATTSFRSKLRDVVIIPKLYSIPKLRDWKVPDRAKMCNLHELYFHADAQ